VDKMKVTGSSGRDGGWRWRARARGRERRAPDSAGCVGKGSSIRITPFSSLWTATVDDGQGIPVCTAWPPIDGVLGGISHVCHARALSNAREAQPAANLTAAH
jgi:hypothetical protein